MAIDTERYCLRCGRDENRCICEIEFVHGPAYGEHRGSRALDADFRAASDVGFAPLTPEAKEAFHEKLESMGAVIYGRRR